MEINSKPAVNSGETLAMFDKLKLFFEENDVENELLPSVVWLTKKSRKCEYIVITMNQTFSKKQLRAP